MGNKYVERETCKVNLHVPRLEELSFRQTLYADPQTMDFGDEPFDFSGDLWQAWFDKWVKNPDGRFYAYLVKEESGEPVGDVNWHFDKDFGEFMIGVVILASERGKGYAQQGLRLLCEKARACGIKRLCNTFPKERSAAIHLHKKLGFEERFDKETKRCVFLEKRL